MTDRPKIDCARPWLIVRCAEMQRMVSCLLNGGGLVEAISLAWLAV